MITCTSACCFFSKLARLAALYAAIPPVTPRIIVFPANIDSSVSHQTLTLKFFTIDYIHYIRFLYHAVIWRQQIAVIVICSENNLKEISNRIPDASGIYTYIRTNHGTNKFHLIKNPQIAPKHPRSSPIYCRHITLRQSMIFLSKF